MKNQTARVPTSAIPDSEAAPAERSTLVPLPDAVALFLRVCRMESLSLLLNPSSGYVRCWTPRITLLAMILGHLMGRATMERVLALMRTGVADAVCAGSKKLSFLLESCCSTSAYAQARARLGLGWLRRCLRVQTQELRSLAGGWQWHGMEIRVLDGTMITLRPFGRIPLRFPPHSNQHGNCYWCQMRVVACMCLGTGVILSLIIGNAADSEQAQCVRLMLFGGAGWPPAPPATILWMGDANFGIWRVVAASRQSSQRIVVRLTSTRAKKLAGSTPLTPGLDKVVTWSPSPADQIDRGLVSAPVVGRLIVRRLERCGFRPLVLLLFTTVEDPAITPEQLAALYLKRWKIELSLRHFKTQMSLGEISAKSPAMAKRELFTGVLAYNLVRGVMLLGGAIHRQPLWQLSFAKAREELLCAMMQAGNRPASDAAASHWRGILVRVAAGKLPQRRKPRPPEPRRKRHRRETFPPLRGDRATARKQDLLANERANEKS